MFAALPAPDTPDLASTMMEFISIRLFFRSGVRAKIVAVGKQPGLANKLHFFIASLFNSVRP